MGKRRLGMPDRRFRRIIGLMSGTSCDGVDAALVEVAGRSLRMRCRLIAHHHYPYPATLRRSLLAVMAPAETTTQELCRLNVAVGEAFAHAADTLMTVLDCRAASVDLIGSHGQTVCHLPPARHGKPAAAARDSPGALAVGSTLQIGDAAIIANRTGVSVVSDFRQADMALGGQGAPLVPWTDYVLFNDRRRSRILQNIGGIANLTYLPAGGTPGDVIAFDTGPGNMVIDELVCRFTRGRRGYDRDGLLAARGHVDPRLLRRLLKDRFFHRRPPKSCGREQFGATFVDRAFGEYDIRKRGIDLIATATALTVRSIADAYRRFLPRRDGKARIDEIIVCGGGAQNPVLLAALAGEVADARLFSIDDFGIPNQAKEAVSFALLAAACVDGVPANMPQVTGASRAAILGRITRV
jgi:anhydro-N-acetylmuramic acid kinase